MFVLPLVFALNAVGFSQTDTLNGSPAATRSMMPVGEDPLKISEICPRPGALDPNGMVSGWIELWNGGESDIDLADYEIVRVNRGSNGDMTVNGGTILAYATAEVAKTIS